HGVELVQFRQDHDASASVGAAVLGGVVGHQWHVFTAATSGDAGGVHAEVLGEHAGDGRGAHHAQVPIVLEAIAANGHVIGVALHKDVHLRLIVHHGGHLAQHLLGARPDGGAAAGEEHLVAERDEDH